jgi:hypothetical protein
VSFLPGNEFGQGRPKGSRNRRTQEILDLIRARGDKDPLDALSEIVSTSPNPEHRITASNILAPYVHSKRGTIPAPRFVEDQITVPEFQTVLDAENFLADIARRAGAGELELQCATDISNLAAQLVDVASSQERYRAGNTSPSLATLDGVSVSAACC